MIAFVVLVAAYLLVPSYYYFKLPPELRNDKAELAKVLPKWAPSRKLNLGLDLQGGIHLLMKVDVDAALAAKATNRASEIKEQLDRKELKASEARSVNGTQIAVNAPAGKRDEAEKAIADFVADMQVVSSSGDSITYGFRTETVKFLKDGAIEQSIKAIRNRVDKFGVSEPIIARHGANHILVQLPGFKDPEQARELIGKTAQLEFRMLDEQDRSVQSLQLPTEGGFSLSFEGTGQPYLLAEDQKALIEFLKGKAPAGRVFATGRIDEPARRGEQPKPKFRSYVLEDKATLTGEYLTDASVQMGEDAIKATPHVALTFNKRGADLFEQLTGANIGKRMAIVLDGVVNSAPVIQDRIGGGRAQITLGGGFKSVEETMQEAQNLALVLKAGALPAPVEPAEQRSVGASLGPELIHSGAIAVMVGTLLIVLFMLLYYRVSGLVADIALLLNGFLILAALALFGASLTLPGIAGIVLTLGVAVDANVIINERIREELKAGKSARQALELGYDKAFAAIFDSNLTTVLSGLVLLQYGTGPVRGFAVTLIIGVTASMFTAIVVTRWMMDFLVARSPQRISV